MSWNIFDFILVFTELFKFFQIFPRYHTSVSQSPRSMIHPASQSPHGIILHWVNLPGVSYSNESISPGYHAPGIDSISPGSAVCIKLINVWLSSIWIKYNYFLAILQPQATFSEAPKVCEKRENILDLGTYKNLAQFLSRKKITPPYCPTMSTVHID